MGATGTQSLSEVYVEEKTCEEMLFPVLTMWMFYFSLQQVGKRQRYRKNLSKGPKKNGFVSRFKVKDMFFLLVHCRDSQSVIYEHDLDITNSLDVAIFSKHKVSCRRYSFGPKNCIYTITLTFNSNHDFAYELFIVTTTTCGMGCCENMSNCISYCILHHPKNS